MLLSPFNRDFFISHLQPLNSSWCIHGKTGIHQNGTPHDVRHNVGTYQNHIGCVIVAVAIAAVIAAGIAPAIAVGIASGIAAGIAAAKKTCLLRVFVWIEDFMSGYCNRPNDFKFSIFTFLIRSNVQREKKRGFWCSARHHFSLFFLSSALRTSTDAV